MSVELLVKWLSRYEFKGWNKTETRGIEVTARMKEQRAQRIADLLNDTARWHSHARGIDAKTLPDEVGLRIDDLASEPELHGVVRTYFDLLKDYMGRQELYSFVHTGGISEMTRRPTVSLPDREEVLRRNPRSTSVS